MASAPVPAVVGMAKHGQGRIDDLQIAADILQIIFDRRALIVRGHGRGGFGQIDGRPAAYGQHEIADLRLFHGEVARITGLHLPLPAREECWPPVQVRFLRLQ